MSTTRLSLLFAKEYKSTFTFLIEEVDGFGLMSSSLLSSAAEW